MSANYVPDRCRADAARCGNYSDRLARFIHQNDVLCGINRQCLAAAALPPTPLSCAVHGVRRVVAEKQVIESYAPRIVATVHDDLAVGYRPVFKNPSGSMSYDPAAIEIKAAVSVADFRAYPLPATIAGEFIDLRKESRFLRNASACHRSLRIVHRLLVGSLPVDDAALSYWWELDAAHGPRLM